jgi:hypothetical protein
MKMIIELDLNMSAYQQKYGPGSEFEKKYGPRTWTGTPAEIRDLVEEIIGEGFYDWDNEGWVKSDVKVN